MNKSLWKFGTREVVYAAIGAALYALLSVATNFMQLPSAGNVSDVFAHGLLRAKAFEGDPV